MIIHIIGKARLKGTSKKTGQPYDFIQCHYNGKSYGVEGLAGLTFTLDPNLHSLESIVVDADYDVEFANRGRVLEMAFVG